MRSLKPRKAEVHWYTIGLLLAFVVAVVLIIMVGKGSKIGKEVGLSVSSCNVQVAGMWSRCACFYEDKICPENCASSPDGYEGCPLDNAECGSDEKFAQSLDAAKALAKGNPDSPKTLYHGTCCRGCTTKS